ncbi:hypothetical protein KV580_28235 [Pseudomonas chlororaphis]|nr:hypothetical protein [Pseudomonas chlororaphis]
MSNGMKDGVGSSDKAARDIGGSQLLGRGLNRLDWSEASKERQKVGDTETGKHPVSSGTCPNWKNPILKSRMPPC